MTGSENGMEIKKEESVMLQGIAILLMLYHHFFNDLSIYGDSLFYWNQGWTIKIAWFGKICVGIFAFISGYGMCKMLEREKEEGFFHGIGRRYLTCFRQMGSLLIRYWLVLICFMGFFFLIGEKKFELTEFGKNFALIEYSYNGAHWYVGQYLKMLFLLPLLDGLFMKSGERAFQKKKHLFYGFLFAAGIITLGVFLGIGSLRPYVGAFANWMRVAFVLVFFVGYLMAKFKAVQWIFSMVESWKKGALFALGTMACLAVMAVRMKLADSPAYATLDFLFVPIFVIGILLITRNCRIFHFLFLFFGLPSAYVWLTHLFVYDLTKDWATSLTKSHLAFYAMELMLAFLIGNACMWVEAAIKGTLSKKPQA